MAQLRLGILGAARIARKNWPAIRHSGNCIVTGVASRDLERARQFVRDCQQQEAFEKEPRLFDSYEALLKSPDVDAVYIPLPTCIRKEWVTRAAATGKHVLCEKPCAPHLPDLREMIAACQRNRVQFMDGVMFMHNPRLAQIRAVLDDGKSIGAIRRITTQFTFAAAADFVRKNIRADGVLEPSGCLGDLGWYCVRFALWAMRWQMPERVGGNIMSEFQAHNGSPPVPSDFSGELIFADGVSSGFYCSFLAERRQWADIVGERGYLRVPDFVLSKTDMDCGFELNDGKGGTKLDPNPAGAQAANMFRNFANQAMSGTLDDFWPSIALKTQSVVDACLEAARSSRFVVPETP